MRPDQQRLLGALGVSDATVAGDVLYESCLVALDRLRHTGHDDEERAEVLAAAAASLQALVRLAAAPVAEVAW